MRERLYFRWSPPFTDKHRDRPCADVRERGDRNGAVRDLPAGRSAHAWPRNAKKYDARRPKPAPWVVFPVRRREVGMRRLRWLISGRNVQAQSGSRDFGRR